MGISSSIISKCINLEYQRIPPEIVTNNILVFLPVEKMLQLRILSRACQETFVREIVSQFPKDTVEIFNIVVKIQDPDIILKLSPNMALDKRIAMFIKFEKKQHLYLDLKDHYRRAKSMQMLFLLAPKKDVATLIATLPFGAIYPHEMCISEDEYIDKFYLHLDSFNIAWRYINDRGKVIEKFMEKENKVPESIIISYLSQSGSRLMEDLKNNPTIYKLIVASIK